MKTIQRWCLKVDAAGGRILDAAESYGILGILALIAGISSLVMGAVVALLWTLGMGPSHTISVYIGAEGCYVTKTVGRIVQTRQLDERTCINIRAAAGR